MHDRDASQEIIESIVATVLKGNPIIDTPSRMSFPKPAVLSYANVKSWSTFEKGALCWKILRIESSFQLQSLRKSVSGGWEDDPGMLRSFCGDNAILELASYLVELVQAA